MEKIHIVVDLEKCIGCYNCMVSCKDEFVGNSWLPYTDAQQKHEQKWINPEKHERGVAPFTEADFVTKLCQHCKNAACEKAQPEAVKRRDDGVILLDAEKAKGNKELVKACPYGMISWNEELQTAQKCTMCAHLLDSGWAEPRCVQACPLRALSIVKCGDEEFGKMTSEQGLEPLYDGDCEPRVVYRNLYRQNTCFIAGALAYSEGGVERAAAGAEVKLLKNGEAVSETKTDFFGEFKIDRIPKNSGTYTIVCAFDGYRTIEDEVSVNVESPCLETMFFEKG